MTYDSTEPVTVSAKALRAAFRALESQIDTVRIVPDERGWHIYGLAIDHASMVNADINAEAFSEYVPWYPFAMRVSSVLEPLSKPGDSVTMRVDGGRMVMTVGRYTFTKGMEADFEEYPRIPERDLTVETAMSASILQEIAGCVSEKEARSRELTLRQTADRMDAESYEYGDPVNRVTVSVPKADALVMGGEGSATYSHARVREIASAIPKDADVDMLYGPRDILRLSYTVDHADMVFVLAPWIEEDD